MKKLSLRIRFTLTASIFLLISCTVLTFLSNFSANKMVAAIEIQPSFSAEKKRELTEVMQAQNTLPAFDAAQTSYEIFRNESIVATCMIVLIGGIATYLAAGYVLKPIKSLAQEVKKRNINNFAQMIPVPVSADEVQDLTVSFNQLLEELQRSFTMQRQFSADVAHELRTPLAVMQTKLDVFSLSAENKDEETKKAVAALQDQLGRLTKLIEDLLWFSRDLPLETVESVPLLPLLEDVADELSELAAQKRISIQITGVDCCVTGQDRLLERVFYNLIENAIKYSASDTSIKVEIEQFSQKTQVTVADQGEGIPKEYRELIFEPFFRIDKSRSRAIGGSGLGLAVCRKILERHHAAICVMPNHPCGCIFKIDFPA
ncbi:MAG: HAMP domain-containing sensor histidine kinase [Eubacteriales bacterium]|nr:HAMP domain-containing sensor histidine kinase [Eubacteriales bacterium]